MNEFDRQLSDYEDPIEEKGELDLDEGFGAEMESSEVDEFEI